MESTSEVVTDNCKQLNTKVKEVAKLKFDREITISSAGNRFAVIWTKQKIYWSELIEKLKTPVRSPETLEEYLKYPKSKQDNLKDVGGFVGGELIDNNRKKRSIRKRHNSTRPG